MNNHQKISGLIIAKNESDNIVDCIESIAFCDEIIVIDDFSQDNTAELAKLLGAIVYQREMQGDFGAQQNFAISKANYEWLLFIDCDERITPKLGDEILLAIQKTPIAAYKIKRLNYFGNKKVRFGNMHPDYVCRLLPRQGTTVKGQVHQRIQHPYPEHTLKYSMLHYTYQSWDEYYNKFNQYTRLSADRYQLEGKKSHFFFDLIFRPCWGFLKMYFIHLGCLDGKLGFVLAKNHAFYTYTKYARFYYLQHPITKSK